MQHAVQRFVKSITKVPIAIILVVIIFSIAVSSGIAAPLLDMKHDDGTKSTDMQWRSFTVSDGQFRVLFPSQPTETPVLCESHRCGSMYTGLDANENKYAVSFQQNSDSFDPAKIESALRYEVEVLRAGSGGDIESAKIITKNGYPGIEALIRLNSLAGYVKMQIFYVANKKYILTTQGQKLSSIKFDKFVGSFELLTQVQ